MFPDKVDFPTPMKLFRNGVTADCSLPKTLTSTTALQPGKFTIALNEREKATRP